MARDAVYSNASRLIKVEIEEPESLIARNTAGAIKSGLFYGWVSMIDGLIGRINDYYKRDLFVIITGGYSALIGNHITQRDIIDPNLTMKGIKIINDLNK